MANGRAGNAGHADLFGLALEASIDPPPLHFIAVIEAPENQPADLRKNPGEAEVG